MAFTLIDGVIANDAFATPATPGTSALVDGINNQGFKTPASATNQPVDAVLGLTTWAAGGGGGGTAVNPGAGAFAFTGYAPTVSQTRSAAPGVGALAFTGYAPSILQPYGVTPGAGGLVFTGYAPSILQTQSANPGVGNIVFTGYAPSILQPKALIPDVGALAFTGYAPTVAQTSGSATNVTPDVGVFTFTGYSVTIDQTQSVTPGIGTLVFTGYAPVITRGVTFNIDLDVGTLVFTGYAPAVDQSVPGNNSATPDVGIINFTGFAPLIEQSGQVQVDPTWPVRRGILQFAKGETDAERFARWTRYGLIKTKKKEDPIVPDESAAIEYAEILKEDIEQIKTRIEISRSEYYQKEFIKGAKGRVAKAEAEQQVKDIVAKLTEARAVLEQELEELDVMFVAATMMAVMD